MNTFFKYVQPSIIKTSGDIELREDLRNQYMVNFNIFGIDYFEDTYLLTENSNGEAFYILNEDEYLSQEDTSSDEDPETEDAWHIDLESSNITRVIDLPRIYITLSQKFMNDTTKIFQTFICKAVENPALFAEGLPDFKPGKDYFMNKTLFDFLYENSIIEYNDSLKMILPNYLVDDEGNISITKYWIDRTGDEDEDYTNLYYFYNKNLVVNTYTFNEDELNAFCSTFCGIILDRTLIDDVTKNTQINQIYNQVLEYYHNYSSDEASVALNLILNSLYSTTDTSSCSCSTCSGMGSTGDTTYNTTSCYDLYSQAMQTYLSQMLGSKDFYYDWMYVYETDKIKIPNTGLIDMLITLIEEFISMGYDLSFDTTNNSTCSCPVVDSSASDCNYKILNNYLKVLNWVKNDEICQNVNKIKIFSQQFAELLSKLNL